MSYFGQIVENEGFNTLVPIERFYPDLAPSTVSNATSESSSEPLFQGTRILYWYHPDYVSNVDLVTDVNGEAYELFLYNAWGESLHHWTSNSSNSWSSPYRFNSKELDPETGMHYYGARYHHPKLSVWMSVDPLASQNLNHYQFTGNNPLMYFDPDGRDTSFADNNTREEFNSTYQNVEDGIEVLDEKIETKLAKWKEKGYENERLNKRMTRKIGRLNSRRAKLLDIKASFDDVINSETMFHYTARPNPGMKYLAGGGTGYNIEKDRVDIWFYSGLGETIVHETRHGAGFVRGEWGWDIANNKPTNYDYQDEYVAFRQGGNYSWIINQQEGTAGYDIKKYIRDRYGSKSSIIKEFRQHCEE